MGGASQSPPVATGGLSDRRVRMTRETKAGLVVASSFLCLVAAVVAVKLREEETPGDDQPEVAAVQPEAGRAGTQPKLERPVAPGDVAQPTGKPMPASRPPPTVPPPPPGA